MDGALDEVISDAKTVVSSQSTEDQNERDAGESAIKAEGAQKAAEADKETLAELLKMLLVRVLCYAVTTRRVDVSPFPFSDLEL